MTKQSEAYLDIDSPAYQSPAYRSQLNALNMVSDCYAGQEAIKRGGQKYLPKDEGESLKAYRARQARSRYFNAYRRTIMGLVGMVFRKIPILQSDVPQQIRVQMENVDMMRSSMTVFLKEAFKWAVAEGHCAILVDMPQSVTATNPAATLADEQGLRPYWALYRKRQIINWRFEDNRLVQVTLNETVQRPDGKYGEKSVERYRVLRPGSWELFEVGEDGKPNRKSGGDTKTAEGKLLDEIPLVIIPGDRDTHMTSNPPLIDLAYENIGLYQLQSDLTNILHFANVLVLWEEDGSQVDLDGLMVAGRLTEAPGKKPERVLSPNTIQHVGHGGSLNVLEHKGTAIGSAQDERAAIRKNLAVLGLSMLADEPQVSSTAAENILEYEAETSELAGMAGSLEDGAELALEFQARFQGLGADGGSIKVNREFTRWRIDGRVIAGLAILIEKKGMSLETMWSFLQNGELPPDFQAKEELMRLLKEGTVLGSLAIPGLGSGSGTGSGAVQ